MQIFVGGLNHTVTENELKAVFEPYGLVNKIILCKDALTGRPRGFGFVTMEPIQANRAIAELDGVVLNGRKLTVAKGNR